MLKTALKFIRPRILVSCYAIVFLGAASTGPITNKTIFSALILILWYIHAASANDYSDRFIDAINLKDPTDRPLLTQDASHRKLWVVHTVAGLLALAASALLGLGAIGFTVGMIVLDYAYSIKPIRISDRGIFSQFLLAFAYVCYPFTLGYWSHSPNSPYPWLLALGIYLAFVARLLLKDFRDVEGDKKHGKMTFVLRHGIKTTCQVSGLFWLVALAIVAWAASFNVALVLILILGLLQVYSFLAMLANSSSIAGHESMVALIAKSANITLLVILTFYLVQPHLNLTATESTLILIVPGVSFLALNFLRALEWQRVYRVH